MIHAFEVAPIPGVMLGIEFPMDGVAFVVIDLFILRIIWYKIDPEDLEEETPK